ncbi:tRNA-dihydrouridine synthase family protein [Limisphaera ngatamarikiensis]|uniref:tRNA-dihydrouridine synthase n=1 Tax=Limisphaera ngatamarikiensis TaxID=1324935 RepID=A0A6M1RJI7_9BACT|nr:tRNA-dihydrouridine synthase family protein [Limisphaera ngatamarikiensis]NGO40228.1 tRNA-dihydrouridine synthase family protein [Limisphaera ngatamarikiensis]
MQDVTDAAFWGLIQQRGGADAYWTEYTRVHATSRPEKAVVRAILNNPTGRPVVAQMMGNDPDALARTARLLEQLPVAAIELNLGCPAPVVYRKCAGGGLLRQPRLLDQILGRLRDTVTLPLSLKTRLGFDSDAHFDQLLDLYARHRPDLVIVHARTVLQGYGLPVRYDLIQRAAQSLPCPVLANGHIHDPHQALQILQQTGARGWMIGRAAIRNPWIFSQIRQALSGQPIQRPTGRDVLHYIEQLWESYATPGYPERLQTQRLKLFTNFIGEGLGPDAGAFLHAIRRSQTRAEFFEICRRHLDHDRPLDLNPHPGPPPTPANTNTLAPAVESAT